MLFSNLLTLLLTPYSFSFVVSYPTNYILIHFCITVLCFYSYFLTQFHLFRHPAISISFFLFAFHNHFLANIFTEIKSKLLFKYLKYAMKKINNILSNIILKNENKRNNFLNMLEF